MRNVLRPQRHFDTAITSMSYGEIDVLRSPSGGHLVTTYLQPDQICRFEDQSDLSKLTVRFNSFS